MSAPEIIAYAVVLFIGVPAMLRNWTAVALIGSFLAVHVIYALTGISSLAIDVMCDYVVVIVMFLKVETRDCSPFTMWGQIRGCWIDLTRGDKAVLWLFAPAWAAYALNLSDQHRYWMLWSVGLLQFFVAGAEAFTTWRRSRAVKVIEAHPAEPSLRWGLVGNEC